MPLTLMHPSCLDRAELATQIVQYCIHPRSLMSPMDADFCVQMIKVLHGMGTPGFSTLMCYDKVRGHANLG